MVSITVEMELHSRKIHSIRYDCRRKADEKLLRSIYVGNEFFDGPGTAPDILFVTVSADRPIEEEEEGEDGRS